MELRNWIYIHVPFVKVVSDAGPWWIVRPFGLGTVVDKVSATNLPGASAAVRLRAVVQTLGILGVDNSTDIEMKPVK